MSEENTRENNKTYFSVINGEFRTQVPKDYPNVIVREWESKDKSTRGIKYERAVESLSGYVEGVDIRDGNYGKQIYIYLDKSAAGKVPVMQFGVDSRYGDDVLKKLPFIEPAVEYRFAPYSFTPKGEDKEKRGVSITSRDGEGNFTVKLGNFFSREEVVNGKKVYTALHGYPEPTEEDKNDWPFYFKKASKFMVKYAEENVIPKFLQTGERVDYPKDDINPDDIPF